MKLEIIIEGKPVPQGRPRFSGYHAVDPQESREEKKRIGSLALIAMREQKWTKTEKPVQIICRFYGAHGGADLDNLTKLVMDSFKGIVWKDDKQVHELAASRQPIEKGREHTKIIIEEII